MSQFVYFIRGEKPNFRERIPHVFADAAPSEGPIPVGPDGHSGWLASLDRAGGAAFAPDVQEWLDCGNGVWVGMWIDRPRPRPADLAREQQLAGATIELADGNSWEVPRLRSYFAGNGWGLALPGRLKRVAGEWVEGEVLPEYAAYDELGRKLVDRMIALHGQAKAPDVAVTMTILEAADIVAQVLAINYRVSCDELSLLGTMSLRDGRLVSLLRVATDYDAAENFVLGKRSARDE